MSLAHLTLPTRDVEKTAAFLEKTLGYLRDPIPENIPCETVWLNIGRGQQIHVFYVEGFEVSPFEGEFGRHVAVFYPRPQFEGLKQRLQAARGRTVRAAESDAVRAFFLPRAGERVRLRGDRPGSIGVQRIA